MTGFCAIGVYHPKHAINIGTLWRSASIFGAAFVFTVGRRYQKQSSDTIGAISTVPLFHFSDVRDLIDHLPHSCPLVGVELDERADKIEHFRHPARAAYMLGAEDNGLPEDVRAQVHRMVRLPGYTCLNVATAGSIILYDRWRTGRRSAALAARTDALGKGAMNENRS